MKNYLIVLSLVVGFPLAIKGQIMDTLYYPTFTDACGTNGEVETPSGTWGFVGGTNGFRDIEKAQRFDFTGSGTYTIQEAWVYFAQTIVRGGGGLLVNIYSVNEETGAPTTLLRSSELLNINAVVLDTIPQPTIFSFAVPEVLNATSFFLSVDFTEAYLAGDQAAVFMTRDGCGDGSNSWERLSDNRWLPINDSETWGFNSDFFIAAVVEFDAISNTEESFVQKEELRLYPAFPNPGKDQINFNYHLSQTTEVLIEIYTSDGKLVRRIDNGVQGIGKHTSSIEVNDWAHGTYVYSVITKENRLMSRFVLK